MSDLDRRLAAVAARQHSLITLDQVLEAGGDVAQANRRVNAGRWERPARGVYRIAGAPWTDEATLLAAVLAAGPGAVASHFSAARMLDIGFRRATPELSIPRGRRHRPPDVRVHESSDLDRCTIRVVDGIPVTDVERTLLDIARYLHRPSLGKAVTAARRQELTDWPALVRTLVTHARQGRHGIQRLREVIAEGMLIDGVTDTDSELIALTLMRERGLPNVELHHQIRDVDGELVAELDFAFLPNKAAVEIDGTVHLDPEVRAKDEARDHFLRKLGWTIRRVWYEVPLRQPDQFLRLVRTLLAETEPQGLESGGGC